MFYELSSLNNQFIKVCKVITILCYSDTWIPFEFVSFWMEKLSHEVELREGFA